MAIDAKDDVTHSHVRRVQAYAVGMARALGFTDESTLKAIEAAALLHDTGKLAVPEHILNKPGKLTPSEFEKMKLHVDVGADILSLVDFPYPVVPIVRCHHENWDGTGYPRGVKGEAIPIGARILSVVDCFDALTSDRPYRRAMTEEAALGILRERSGKMYDPAVVDMFIKVFRDIPVASHDAAETTEVMQRIAQSKHEAPAPVIEAPAAPSTFAASSNLLACVSLARVAGGEGSLADVLALSSNLVNDILPAATGAWFVPDHVARSARGGRRVRTGGDDARRILRRRRRPSDRLGRRQPPADPELGRLARSGRPSGRQRTASADVYERAADRRGDARGRPEPLFRGG